MKHVFVLPHLPVFLPRMVLFEVVPEVRGRGMGMSFCSTSEVFCCLFFGGGTILSFLGAKGLFFGEELAAGFREGI